MTKTIDKPDTIKSRFIENFSKDEVRCNVSLACDATGISRETFYQWMKNDEAFLNVIEEVKARMRDDMESVLVNRAVDNSDTALIFWLKNRHPDFKPQPTTLIQNNFGDHAKKELEEFE
jgi:hypothetical protein